MAQCFAFGCSESVGGGQGASGCGGKMCRSRWSRTQAQSSRHGLCHRIPTLFGSVRLATTRLLVFGQRSGWRWLVLYPFVAWSCLEMGWWQCCVRKDTFVCFATTQLALRQLHQEHTQVVYSNKVTWKCLARMHSRNEPWTHDHLTQQGGFFFGLESI